MNGDMKTATWSDGGKTEREKEEVSECVSPSCGEVQAKVKVFAGSGK